jgi:hypothetical protein
MESNGRRRYKFVNNKENIWEDWSHTKKRWRNTNGRLTMEPSGKQEDGRSKIIGKDRVSKKWGEVGMN